MSTRELAEAEARDRKPGDPIDAVPLLWFDEIGYSAGPAIMWVNPWSGKPEAVCAFWWPSHPEDDTAAIENLWDRLGALFVAAPEARAKIERVRKDLLEGQPDGEWYDGVTAACDLIAKALDPSK